MVVPANLHSILVLLKAIENPQYYQNEKNLHSILVLLKGFILCAESFYSTGFTFHSGSIKGAIFPHEVLLSEKFTFHSGSIKGYS